MTILVVLLSTSSARSQNSGWGSSGTAVSRLTVPLATSPVTSPVQIGQLLTSNVLLASDLTGVVGMIWGDNKTPNALYPIPGVLDSYYFTGHRTYPGGTVNGLSWLYANHAEWIEYCNDRITPAYEFTNTVLAPVNFTDPHVVAWIAATSVSTGKAHTSAGVIIPVVALDNVTPYNNALAGGHYAGASSPCTPPSPPTPPSCGGTWVQDFAGGITATGTNYCPGTLAYDQVYTAAEENYINLLRQLLRAQGVLLFINIYADAATTGSSAVTSWQDEALLGSFADGVLSESYPLSGTSFKTDSEWDNQYRMVVAFSSGWWYAISYYYYSGGPHAGAQFASNWEKSWIVSNYLLVAQNPAQNFLSVSARPLGSPNPPPPDFATVQTYDAPYEPAVGSAMQAPPSAGCRPCVRLYTNGIVAVNPDSVNSYSITIPSHGSHTDQFGNSVAAGSYMLSAASGVVIIGPPT